MSCTIEHVLWRDKRNKFQLVLLLHKSNYWETYNKLSNVPILKGRFFMWQQKLGASKIIIKTESFSELYNWACTLKRQEKQISASAAIRGDTRAPTEKSTTNYLMSPIDIQQSKIMVRDAPQVVSGIKNSKPNLKSNSKHTDLLCSLETYNTIKVVGFVEAYPCWTHIAGNCNRLVARSEASGRSGKVSRTAVNCWSTVC